MLHVSCRCICRVTAAPTDCFKVCFGWSTFSSKRHSVPIQHIHLMTDCYFEFFELRRCRERRADELCSELGSKAMSRGFTRACVAYCIGTHAKF